VAGVKGFLGNADEFYESSDFEGANLRSFVTAWWENFEGRSVGVSEIYKLIMESDLQIEIGNGKSERSQKTSLGKILSSLRDRHIGGYRVVNAGNKNGAQLWKLIGQEVTVEVVNEHPEHRGDVQTHVQASKLLKGHDKMNINEHTEHFLAEEIIHQDIVSNISGIIQYSCDMSKKNDIVLTKNVQDVQDVHLIVKEQPLIVPEHHTEHPDFQTCSDDVHCESLTQPCDISSKLPVPKAFDLLLTDDFAQPKTSAPESKLTPFICRRGCKHYDSVTDATDGIFKEYCCYGRSYLIKESSSCNHFEDKNPVCDDDDGILRF
jgi:hypothetical protein